MHRQYELRNERPLLSARGLDAWVLRLRVERVVRLGPHLRHLHGPVSVTVRRHEALAGLVSLDGGLARLAA
jgi:hypothetical protein